jgi:signal transduction histidine kinase
MCCVRIRFLHTEAFRLSAIYAAIFALSVILLGGLALVITERAFRDQVVQFSQADIAAIQNGYDVEGLGEAREVVQQSMAGPGVSDYFLLQKDGKFVAGNLPVMPPRTGVFSLNRGGHEILGVGKMLAPGVYAWSGSDLARVQIARREIVQTMIWLFAAALLLAVTGGALVSRSFLRRSDAMARACRAIMDGDLKARIPVRGTQDELDRLAGTINEMLDRIVALMGNLHQVTNDIAHDLRTPVSQLRQGLERAQEGPQSGHAQALGAAIAKTDDILVLFAAMLRIAEIEGGKRRAAFVPVALGALLGRLHELFGPVAEAAGHTLAVDIRHDVEVRGDPALLTQLLSNLIENAILHTPPGTHITVTLTVQDGRPALTVADDGPGVPASEHGKLFQRLYRREASRTHPGHGLGLSIAQAIAELHGAQIGVLPGSPGLAIRVLFPAPRTPSGS